MTFTGQSKHVAIMVGIELKDVIQLKLDYNAGRGVMHGGKAV